METALKELYDDLNIIITNDEITYINGDEISKKKLNISHNSIKRQLEAIGFKKPYTKDTYDLYYSPKLENSNIPYFNFVYYYYFFKYLKIPTYEKLTNMYINLYCKQEGDTYKIREKYTDNDIEFTKEELIGRISRAINSFHREIDLFFQLRKFSDLELEYNFKKDLSGIDLTMTYKGNKFYIASYLKTNRSLKWKDCKNSKRHVEDYSNYKMIDFIAVSKSRDKQNNCMTINNINLYAPWYVKSKYKEIISIEQKK